MLLDSTQLSSYLASKICHDLVSPVTAAASALDFTRDQSSPEMQEEGQKLLESSTERTLARLQFLRYAFGSMGMHKGAGDIHEAKKITEGYIATHKGAISWDVDVEEISFAHIRVMMNLIMIAMACLPKNGDIIVTIKSTGSAYTIAVDARGAVKWPDDIEAAMSERVPANGWDPRTIQPYFTTLIVKELGGQLTARHSENLIHFVASDLPATIGV